MPLRTPSPRLIPVVDVKGGVVVRAVAGRREQYRPLVSRLTTSTDPQVVTRSLIEVTQAQELYMADLDAILTGQLSPGVIEFLAKPPLPVWIDAGFGPRLSPASVCCSPRIRPIIGFETCPSPDFIRPSQQAVAFSIDLSNGVLLGNWPAWGLSHAGDVLGVARQVIGRHVQSVILLDLTRVGTGSGCGTEGLVRAIRQEFPDVELIAGGGIRDWDDIDRLGEAGADAVLLASALHDGRIRWPRA